MKSTFDQDSILYRVVSQSPLKTAITGAVYKWNRPDGSLLEDVVINALPIGDGSAQRGTGNVNIYVPDVEVTVNGNVQKMPDLGRMKQLTAIGVPLFKEGYGPDYNFWLVNQSVFDEPDTHQHYINFRIDFKFHNQV